MDVLVYFVIGFFLAGYLVRTTEKDAVGVALVVAVLWPIILLFEAGAWARRKVREFM